MFDARARVEAIVQDGDGWLHFHSPQRVLAATRAADIRPALRELERLTRDHRLHAVGWLAYEAAAAFDLVVHTGTAQWPLLFFGLFDAAAVRRLASLEGGDPYELGPLEPRLSRDAFRQGFHRIREHIAAGDTYQANFTFQTSASFDGDPKALFKDLTEAQQGRYSVYFRIGDLAVCSASPELFFELDGLTVRTRPMKGTARRGLTPDTDAAIRERLVASPKERAENVMIVDMMRNDLGRIAEVGSVTVPALFEAERYPTVWQMTSTVEARSSASLEDIFAALHPSASVTGAPKVRTMEILSGLEDRARGLYTGAIGHVPPDGNARFNVAIRTAIVDGAQRRVHFGVGSGIVWDSDADAEYDECLLKAAVLGRRPTAFELLETLRWTPGDGFFLIGRHLDRMEASAGYFGIAWDRARVQEALERSVADASAPQRVRLLVDRHGSPRVERVALPAPPAVMRVALAKVAVSSQNPFLHHKTTERSAYDAARDAVPDVDDVVLWNERGEVTETTIANVVVLIDGARVTPPAWCGLLAGTFRSELLARGEIVERTITIDELRRSTFWLINSVREWMPAELAAP